MNSGAFHLPSASILDAGTTTVGRIFSQRVAGERTEIAVEHGSRRLSYGQLGERTDRLANALLTMGVARQDRVALLSHNSAEFLEVILACAKIGAVVCCQNWRLAPHEVAHCINLVSPRLMFIEGRLDGLLAGQDLAPHRRIYFGDEYEALLADASAGAIALPVADEDGLIILYTSGTTGLPKGAVISHRAMVARAMLYAAELGVPRDDTHIAWSPLFHMGAADQSIATLMRGGKVVVADGFDLEIILPTLARDRVGWFSLLPGVTDTLIDALGASRPKIRQVGTVGGMIDLTAPDQIAEISAYFQSPYLNTFGSTETGLAPATGGLIPIGVAPDRLSKRQSGFCEVRLVDAEDRDVPDGQNGEVVLRGPTLFSGYVGVPEVNEHEFRTGWFHMGDVMRRNADGTLDFVDRIKYLIKSGGENIYPAEIEQLIKADPRVIEVAVVKKGDTRWGEVPVAFIARRDESLREEDIIDLCLAKLARFKRPKEIRFIGEDDFPRTSTGKVRRHILEKSLLNIK